MILDRVAEVNKDVQAAGRGWAGWLRAASQEDRLPAAPAGRHHQPGGAGPEDTTVPEQVPAGTMPRNN